MWGAGRRARGRSATRPGNGSGASFPAWSSTWTEGARPHVCGDLRCSRCAQTGSWRAEPAVGSISPGATGVRARQDGDGCPPPTLSSAPCGCEPCASATGGATARPVGAARQEDRGASTSDTERFRALHAACGAPTCELCRSTGLEGRILAPEVSGGYTPALQGGRLPTWARNVSVGRISGATLGQLGAALGADWLQASAQVDGRESIASFQRTGKAIGINGPVVEDLPRGYTELDMLAECVAGDILVTGEAVVDTTWLDLYFALWVYTFQVPNLTFAVMSDDGRLLAARGYTNCSLQNNAIGEVITWPRTQFRIASISKVITAIAAVRLVDGVPAGSCLVRFPDGLDTRVSDYYDFSNNMFGIPQMDSRMSEMRLWHLLTHSSGWWDGNTIAGGATTGFHIGAEDNSLATLRDKELPISLDDTSWFANSFPLTFTPGTDYTYCGHPWNVVTMMMEALTGVDPVIFIGASVLGAVGAVDTARTETGVRGTQEAGYFMSSYPVDVMSFPEGSCTLADYGPTYLFGAGDDPCRYRPYGGEVNYDFRLGQTGWMSTPTDLLLLARWFLPDRVDASPLGLSPSTVEAMFTKGYVPTRASQGLAWVHQGSRNGFDVWDKQGDDNGAISHLALFRRGAVSSGSVSSDGGLFGQKRPGFAIGGFAIAANKDYDVNPEWHEAWDSIISTLLSSQVSLISVTGGSDLFDVYPLGGR